MGTEAHDTHFHFKVDIDKSDEIYDCEYDLHMLGITFWTKRRGDVLTWTLKRRDVDLARHILRQHQVTYTEEQGS